VEEKISAAAQAYNTAFPVTWGRAWMNDPPGGSLCGHWEGLIKSFRSRAPLGESAPEFSGELLDGGEFRLSGFRGRKSVLLVFGSIACPPCVTNISANTPSLVSLYAQYRDAVEFCYVYTREAHPGRKIGPHTGMGMKKANAAKLRQEEGMTFPLVVDSMEGTIHQSYVDPQFNNSVFLVNRAGIIVYKSAWLDTSELPQVLDDVKLWDERGTTDKAIKKTYSERIRPLREPFDSKSNAKFKWLMEFIGLNPHEMGNLPGLAADASPTATKSDRKQT